MEYTLLTEEAQHEMLAATLEAQERDHYMHTLNLARYKTMLGALADAHPERLKHEAAIAKAHPTVKHEEPHPGDTMRRSRGEVLNDCQHCQFQYRMRWLHDDTALRLSEVEHIMNALAPQLPHPDKLRAAHARIKANGA